MSTPLYVEIQEQLINLSTCNHLYVEDEYLYLDEIEFEFSSEAEAQAELDRLKALMAANGLLLGEPPPPA